MKKAFTFYNTHFSTVFLNSVVIKHYTVHISDQNSANYMSGYVLIDPLSNAFVSIKLSTNGDIETSKLFFF